MKAGGREAGEFWTGLTRLTGFLGKDLDRRNMKDMKNRYVEREVSLHVIHVPPV
jgi:hypothetical protein